MLFIKNIIIGSLVIILTKRIDLNSIDIIPAIISALNSFIRNIFAHKTDYNLYLPLLYYVGVNQLTKTYLSMVI